MLCSRFELMTSSGKTGATSASSREVPPSWWDCSDKLHSQSIWSSRNSPSFQRVCLLCLSTLFVYIIQSRRVELEIGFQMICGKAHVAVPFWALPTPQTIYFGPLHQIGNCLIQLASALDKGGCQLLDEIVLAFVLDGQRMQFSRNGPFIPKCVSSVCQPGFYLFLYRYSTIMESRAGGRGEFICERMWPC